MLQLDTTAYSLSGIPYITFEALDEFAESVIRDFNPENLKAPAILDVAKFVKFYLEIHVEYKRISCDRKVMAMTAFNTGIVRVYDDCGVETLPFVVHEGTLIIDPVLKEKRNEPRHRFTIMHEASHWMIHRPSFAEGNPFGTPGVFENQYLAAKKGRIDYSRSLRKCLIINLTTWG